jgi:hypothetical protein
MTTKHKYSILMMLMLKGTPGIIPEGVNPIWYHEFAALEGKCLC